MNIFYFILFLVITFLVHFILYALSQFDRKKKQEKLMIDNAALILEKIDKTRYTGGNKMDEDLKKVAKYVVAKIEAAKEEIMEEMNTRFDELEETEEVEETEEDIDLDFEEEEDEGITLTEKPKAIPDSLNPTKRQIKSEIEPEETPTKKPGLFKRKGKNG